MLLSMTTAISILMWLVPPAALIALYWQIAAARQWSVRTRNALAIGNTAALIALSGFDGLGLYRVGPWSVHPAPDWPITLGVGAIAIAAFAFPTGWSCGIIVQHWRAREPRGA